MSENGGSAEPRRFICQYSWSICSVSGSFHLIDVTFAPREGLPARRRSSQDQANLVQQDPHALLERIALRIEWGRGTGPAPTDALLPDQHPSRLRRRGGR